MADKSNDPFAIWQNMLGEMEKGFNSFATQLQSLSSHVLSPVSTTGLYNESEETKGHGYCPFLCFSQIYLCGTLLKICGLCRLP